MLAKYSDVLDEAMELFDAEERLQASDHLSTLMAELQRTPQTSEDITTNSGQDCVESSLYWIARYFA